MILSAIAAMSKNRVIGKDNDLPWHIPEDLKYFKDVTSGKIVIYGRKTFESMGGRPLPKRRNIILSRQASFVADSCEVFSSLNKALDQLKSEKIDENEEVFIIGGAQIYREALPILHRIYLTLIDTEIEGDTFFPGFEGFTLKSERHSSQLEPEPVSYTFQVWESQLLK